MCLGWMQRPRSSVGRLTGGPCGSTNDKHAYEVLRLQTPESVSSSKERRGGTNLGLQLSAVPLPGISVGRSTAHACPKRRRLRSETFSTASGTRVPLTPETSHCPERLRRACLRSFGDCDYFLVSLIPKFLRYLLWRNEIGVCAEERPLQIVFPCQRHIVSEHGCADRIRVIQYGFVLVVGRIGRGLWHDWTVSAGFAGGNGA